MAGEGAEALLNALLVPDVGEHFVKNRQLRALPRGNVKAGLTHEGEKAYGLEGNGLASGVGAGDNQQIEVLSQPKVDGNHLGRVQQGVASVLDVDIAPVVEDGSAALVVAGQGGLGENEVQLGKQLHIQL